MPTIGVIGGGVVGCLALRALTAAGHKAVLFEAAADLCNGATRANSAICHAGYDPVPGSLMARFNRQGCDAMPALCRQLGVPFRQIGSLVLAFNPTDMDTLQVLLQRGIENQVPGLVLYDAQQVHALEPNLADNVCGGLYAPTAGVVSPYELAIAAAENAVENGAEVVLNFEVTGITPANGGYLVAAADGRTRQVDGLINAAGAGCAAIAALLGEHIEQTYRNGAYILFDHRMGGLVQHVLFQPPTAAGKGILVTQTPDGNLLAGPTSHEAQDPADKATTAEQLQEVIDTARCTLPGLPVNAAITQFTGVRVQVPAAHGDFDIRLSANHAGVVHAAGICSPGLTSSPAIAEYLVELLAQAGLPAAGNPAFNPQRQHTVQRFADMDWAARAQAVQQNPAYAHIVCRCESVTEAEILSAIHAPIPARTVDAVKRRTRAGMGRCQGGFCSPRVMEILARECGIPLHEVQKDNAGSWICLPRDKGCAQ